MTSASRADFAENFPATTFAPSRKWAGPENKDGELLGLMADQAFEVLITIDRNLQHQQNLSAAGVAVIVLLAASNRLADMIPLAPSTLTALATIQPGEVVELDS